MTHAQHTIVNREQRGQQGAIVMIGLESQEDADRAFVCREGMATAAARDGVCCGMRCALVPPPLRERCCSGVYGSIMPAGSLPNSP